VIRKMLTSRRAFPSGQWLDPEKCPLAELYMFAIETQPQEAAVRCLDHSGHPLQEIAMQLYHMLLFAYSWELGEEEVKQGSEERFERKNLWWKIQVPFSCVGDS
jgi:hypothetical protein